MTTRWFVDTNVAVYLFDDDEPVKQRVARDLVDSDDAGRLVISTQVLGEFYVTTTRKLHLDLGTVHAAMAALSQFPVVATDLALVRAGVDTAERHQISYWDALIIEAAVVSGCDRVLTEDLAPGSTLRRIEIVNPFA